MKSPLWNDITNQEAVRRQPWIVPEDAWGKFTTPSALAGLINQFPPISLDEIESVALLNRNDIKYILTTGQLLQVIRDLPPEYQVLAVRGRRFNPYRTLYFDTPDLALFHRHINGCAESYKVRSREYTSSGDSFLEVKRKTNQGRTIKNRIETEHPLETITSQAGHWLENYFPYDSTSLEPILWNTFTRITLVNHKNLERVTIDIDLVFYKDYRVVSLGCLAVTEVKQDSSRRGSPFTAAMRAQKIHPQGFSKYCIGTALLYSQIKKNALKPKLLQIRKMIGGTNSNEHF
ncbi:MAG TPA: polyphosphate polymerase domain-containing protein [Anaerolineaceae bacterium]